MFGFEWGVAGRLDIDLHLDIGDVRHGVDGQALVVVKAEGGEAYGGEHHEPAVTDGKLENVFEHDVSSPAQWSCEAPDFMASALMRKLLAVT